MLTLVKKELHQHWWAFLVVALMAGLGYLMMLGSATVQGITPLEALGHFVVWTSVLVAPLLCNRLVVAEYRGRTQLFLEALPMARWQMVTVKYLLGLGVLFAIVAGGFGLAIARTPTEPIAGQFLSIMAARAYSTVWMVYSFCFLMGLLGRYRIALTLAILFGCIMISTETSLEMQRFGPLALMDKNFGFERENFPWEALATTWGLALGLTALALLLSLIREGSVATLLAQKMSYREKVFMVSILVAYAWTLAVLSEKVRKAPFELSEAASERRKGTRVQVASGTADDPRARKLAVHLANELDEAREYLGLSELPPVFLSNRHDLDVNRYERGRLEKSEGLFVQANFLAKGWRDDLFVAWCLREALSLESDGRLELESRRWVLDGFGLFWISRNDLGNRQLSLRALYGERSGFELHDLDAWMRFTEKVGDEIAEGVAWSGLRTLSHQQGPEKCRNFLQAILARKEPRDFRVLFRSRGVDSALLAATGQTTGDFFAAWKHELAASKLGAKLAQLPVLEGKVEFVPLGKASLSRRLEFRLAVHPAVKSRYSFVYYQLPPYDEEVEEKSLQQVRNAFPEEAEGEAPLTLSKGDRLFSSFKMLVPALGCNVVSGYVRQVVP